MTSTSFETVKYSVSDGIAEILESAKGSRFIFNLGHGITPETPIDHVAAMIEQVRAG